MQAATVYKFRGPGPEISAWPASWMIRPCKYFSVMAWL